MAPLFRIALFGLAAVPLVSAAVRSLDGIRNSAAPDIVPNAYIVELHDPASINNFGKRATPHEEFYDHLNKRGISFSKTKEWSVSGIFYGVSVRVDEDSDMSQVVKTPGVKSIQPVRLYKRPEPVNTSGPETYDSNASPHTPTGVDALHRMGIFGAGVTVAIIDTGVDYNHPVLGGGIGPGMKVLGGYDFVGDAYDGLNTPVPDPDPMDCFAHGTHVAGIVAASGPNPYNITGVAPQANLRAYRIFGCKGGTTEEGKFIWVNDPGATSLSVTVVIDAILLAYKDKVDVMNLSLGGPGGWTTSPSSVIASRLADKGIVMAIAAGNDGTQGAWWSSSPGGGASVITAASTDSTVFYFAIATTSTGYGPIGYTSLQPFQWPTLPIYALSTDVTIPNDACEPLPESTPDLGGYLIIIRRGTCTLIQKLTNVASKGAKYVLIYNNGQAFVTPSTGPFVSAMISEQDGAYLVGQFAAGHNITVSFPQEPARAFPNPEGGLISSFTSYGPTYDLYLKPSVAAPGGNILSSIPDNQYAVHSGTSMATPYIAGSAALILSTKGNTHFTGKPVKKYLQTTAKYIGSTHVETGPYNTLIQQGSGLVQVYNAIFYSTEVSPSEILLNDTIHWNGFQTIEIENTSLSSVTYVISHTPAGTGITSDGLLPTNTVALTSDSLEVTFSQEEITVLPRFKGCIAVTFGKPRNDRTLPIYSGWITITASTGEVLSVPYMGVAAVMKDVQIIDDSDFYFGYKTPVVLDGNGAPQSGPNNYTFASFDHPVLVWRRAAGTPRQIVDLVPANSNLNPTYEKRVEWEEFERRGWWGSWFGWWNPSHGGTYAKVPVVGTLLQEEWAHRHGLKGLAGNDYEFLDWESPLFANGTTVPRGSYRFLLRVLKITGDPMREEDYETYLSPVVGVYPYA